MAIQSLQHPQTATDMVEACKNFVESLSADQAAKARYPYGDAERVYWYFAPINRHGLSLRSMSEEQRGLAYKIMSTGLTEKASRLFINSSARSSLAPRIRKPCLGPFLTSAGFAPKNRGVMEITLSPHRLKCSDTW